MDLLYRVSVADVPDVLAGLRAQGFEAEVSDEVVGRGRRAVVVIDISDDDEAAEIDDAMVLLSESADRLPVW